VLRRITGSGRDEVTGRWRILHIIHIHILLHPVLYITADNIYYIPVNATPFSTGVVAV
jgi:hypothetical protein